jgi:hypothetical protein
MSPLVKITDRKELEEFARTHLAHRLTAMAAPICFPQTDSLWAGRNDAYRSAKEGSYSMIRTFIEFLGVKSDRDAPPTLKLAQGDPDSILIDAFASFGAQKVAPVQFGRDGPFMAEIHRTLCKINSHFTYDQAQTAFYDRIASPDDVKEWPHAVDIIIKKLDEHFYFVVGEPITIHFDLEQPFRARFVNRLGLKSAVKGDGLGRPASSPGPD